MKTQETVERKAEYVSPKLTVYGAVAEMTHNTSPLGNDDGQYHLRTGS